MDLPIPVGVDAGSAHVLGMALILFHLLWRLNRNSALGTGFLSDVSQPRRRQFPRAWIEVFYL